MARLANQRDVRAGQHIAAAEAHPQESAAIEPAVRAGPAAHRPGCGQIPAAAGRPRHPERRRPRHRRAGQRTVDARAQRVGAGRAAELTQEIERDVALHPPPQLPAREPAPEARRARRLKPLFHVLDHVHRRRPAEPRHERPRQRIVVLDRPRRLAVGQPAPRGVGQPQRQRLLALVVGVVEHSDLDRRRPLAGPERQRAARRPVVVTRVRAAVRRRVVHRQRGARRAAQRHHERQRHAVAFLHPRVGHRDAHRAGDGRRQRMRQRPAVAGADRPGRAAVRRLRQPDGYRAVGVRY